MPIAAMGIRGVIVTRPALDAGDWVRQLQDHGVAAEALPLIDIAAASHAADVQAVTQAWQAIGNYAGCMFVSGNAVRFFFEKQQACPSPLPRRSAVDQVASLCSAALPPNLRFMAPGPGTAAALLAVGVPAGQIDAPPLDADQFDSEALWKVVGQRDWRGCRVLVVRGLSGPDGEGDKGVEPAQTGVTREKPGVSSGRDWISRQWQAAGCAVDFVGVYARRAPVWTPAQIERARTASVDGSVWLFSSSEAVHHLTHLPGLQGVDWRCAAAIATHPRITQTVRDAGWGVVAESRPALTDIVMTLRSIESRYS